jgi:hypothetical protein
MHMCDASMVKPSVCRQIVRNNRTKHCAWAARAYVSSLVLRGLEQFKRVVGIHGGIERQGLLIRHVC